jgi:hypothetical protein
LHKCLAVVFEDSRISHHEFREMWDGVQFQGM